MMPAPGALLETIERFVEFEHSALLSVESLRNFDVKEFVRLAVQEGTFYVHLVDLEIVECTKGE
jgi:hypothetical protein